MQEQMIAQKGHKIQMVGRKTGMITGVLDVVSFDSKEVVLDTVDGLLQMSGDEFHVRRLSLEQGEVDLEGKIDRLVYSNEHSVKTAGSLLGRLFR